MKSLIFSALILWGFSSWAQTTWTYCAAEGGNCNFSGSKTVRYGAKTSYYKKILTGPVSCTNANFGDPLPGYDKHCDIASVSSTSTTTTTLKTTTTTAVPSSTVTWTRCAAEDGTCSFSGARQVRYGLNGVYNYQTASGSIACNNATFGDPSPGVDKFCDYSSLVQSTPNPTTTTTTTTTYLQQHHACQPILFSHRQVFGIRRFQLMCLWIRTRPIWCRTSCDRNLLTMEL